MFRPSGRSSAIRMFYRRRWARSPSARAERLPGLRKPLGTAPGGGTGVRGIGKRSGSGRTTRSLCPVMTFSAFRHPASCGRTGLSVNPNSHQNLRSSVRRVANSSVAGMSAMRRIDTASLRVPRIRDVGNMQRNPCSASHLVQPAKRLHGSTSL